MKQPRKRAIEHCGWRVLGGVIGKAVCGMGLWGAASAIAWAGCTISSTGLAFGAYQPLTFAGKLTSMNVTGSAAISIACTGIATGGSATISANAGLYGVVNARKMQTAVNNLTPMLYNLFTTSDYTAIWGDGTAGTVVLDKNDSNAALSIPTGDSNQTVHVYGRVLASQNTLKAGSYSDSVIMTLTYSP